MAKERAIYPRWLLWHFQGRNRDVEAGACGAAAEAAGGTQIGDAELGGGSVPGDRSKAVGSESPADTRPPLQPCASCCAPLSQQLRARVAAMFPRCGAPGCGGEDALSLPDLMIFSNRDAAVPFPALRSPGGVTFLVPAGFLAAVLVPAGQTHVPLLPLSALACPELTANRKYRSAAAGVRCTSSFH